MARVVHQQGARYLRRQGVALGFGFGIVVTTGGLLLLVLASALAAQGVLPVGGLPLALVVLTPLLGLGLPLSAQTRQQLSNRRRRQVLDGSATAPEVTPQPVPDLAALTLPVVLIVTPAQRVRTITMAVAVAAALLFVGFGIVSHVTLTAYNLVCLLIALVFTFYQTSQFNNRALQTVIVTESHLLVKHHGERTTSIAWDDVRLFALANGSAHDRQLQYELAGATSRVTWTWQRSARDVRPNIPFADYQRQMAGLLAYIAARTGLPLLDLRYQDDQNDR